MTMLMEEAFERLRTLPAERQDELAPMLMMLAQEEPYTLTPEDKAATERSRAAAARGEFASDKQVRALWSKHGL